MKNEILEYLKSDERFRQRRNKNIGIANLLSKKYGVEIPQDKRDDFISDVLGADRYWRMILAEDESLRGTDYGTKDIIESRTEIALGYEPNYYQDIKLKNRI